MIQALDLSLAGAGAVVPFDSWWKLDCPDVELISLVREEGGATVSKYVSLDDLHAAAARRRGKRG